MDLDLSDTANPATTLGESSDEPADETSVLPWWRSKLNLAVLGTVLALVAGTLGYVIGHNRATPDPNSADVGFLQDMRWHHDQAVQMGQMFLSLPDTSPDLRSIARSIVVGQAQETGLMIGLLDRFGAEENNSTDVAMSWMDHPTPIDEMPGLATTAQLDAFGASRGAAADRMFVELMAAHHKGGIDMATSAADLANTSVVRRLARQMAAGQRGEIIEMYAVLGAPVPAALGLDEPTTMDTHDH